MENCKDVEEEEEYSDDGELVEKRRLVFSTSEGGGTDRERRWDREELVSLHFPIFLRFQHRKFHSLDKKLRRTNLMKRRESQVVHILFLHIQRLRLFLSILSALCPQALLEGIRKSRLSNTNMLAVDKEEVES